MLPSGVSVMFTSVVLLLNFVIFVLGIKQHNMEKSNAESPLDGKHSEELVPFSRTKKSQPASNVRFTTNASFRQSPTDLKRGI